MIKDKIGLTIYHGTASQFKLPELGYTKGQKDFGVGFYVTTDKAQAEQFARMQARRERVHVAYINQYFIMDFQGLHIQEFENANEEWLEFICFNRRRKAPDHGYDIIIGKIANDDTRETLEQYMTGIYTQVAKQVGISPAQFAINLLKTGRLKNQICMCTQKSLDRLKFIKSTVVR